MLISLYGFLEGDFLGRAIVSDTAQTVGALSNQLQAWAQDVWTAREGVLDVTDEQGVVLDPLVTLAEAGLSDGDMFRVQGHR